VKTSKHLSKITTATSQLATWIMRTFKTRDADVMLALWKSLVIPCFGYCSQYIIHLMCPRDTTIRNGAKILSGKD